MEELIESEAGLALNGHTHLTAYSPPCCVLAARSCLLREIAVHQQIMIVIVYYSVMYVSTLYVIAHLCT